MNEELLTGPRRRGRAGRLRRWVLPAATAVAILFQVYVPLFFDFLAYLELPLLVTVYFALLRRSPVRGALLGALVGLAQDSLSHQPLGVFGIVKTLVGYFAGSVSVRFDVEHAALRWFLSYSFFFFHQLFYWLVVRALLAQQAAFELQMTLLFGLLNAAAAVVLFRLLDKMREPV